MEINITSGAQYAKLLTDALREVENELPFYERMDESLLKLWCDEVAEAAKESFVQYIIGNKEDFHLTEDKMNECLEIAGLEYTTNLLDGLVEKGMTDVIYDENGEKLYKLSEKGKQYVQSVNN